MKPGNHSWSEADIETLIAMKRQGHTYYEIGAKIGRTYDAVAGKASNIRRLFDAAPIDANAVPAAPRSQSRGERLTSRFMGDPPPGRSALDQRASQSIPSNKRQQNG